MKQVSIMPGLRGGALLALVLALLPGLCSCESYVRARAFDQHGPLREGSLAWWIPRTIDNEEATAWLVRRAAIVVLNADSAGVTHQPGGKVRLNPTRNGRQAAVSLGSAVAITDDGYFLTVAHCVHDGPMVIVARERDGEVVERPARLVWQGALPQGDTDLAIIHAPGLVSDPLRWCPLAEVRGGREVLSAGIGVNTRSRLAAGTIVGGPTGTDEAPPGRGHVIRIDAPLVPGDSGGPTITADGLLVGINATVEVELFSGRGHGGAEVLRPDPAFIERVIAADRAAKASGTLRP